MRKRSIRLAAALACAAAATPATPALAATPPLQHDAQRLPLSEVLRPSIGAPLPSASVECKDGFAGIYPCKGFDLASFVPLLALGGVTGNDIWGWTDPKSKREFAIMGSSTSTGFVEVTNPKQPRLLGTLPTRGTPDFVLWRDIKVDGHHAYIVSEITGSGLQVFDLRKLLEVTGDSPKVFSADATYDKFSNAHNISINEATDVAYAVGTNTCGVDYQRKGETRIRRENGGLHMVDISKPLEPRFLGCATVDAFDPNTQTEPNNYAHDVECVIYRGPDADYQGREICFGSNENAVVVYDVTDKSAPRVISSATYKNASYTHQGALSGDQRFFLFGDELDEQNKGVNTITYILDAGDLDNLPTPRAFDQGSKSIDHNQYVHGNRTYQSNYNQGLRVLEFDTASLEAGLLEEIGFFDVVPGVDVAEFAGTWSNYRFRSGTTVVSTIENEVNGLFVLTPNKDLRSGKKP